MTVKLFVEGGPPGKLARSQVRKAFRELLGKLRRGDPPTIVACGPRGEAHRSFQIQVDRDARSALLLVDSEEAVTGPPWKHLEAQGLKRPGSAPDDSAHLMIQCMESWLIADPDALRAHFGQGFKLKALPGARTVEAVSKNDVMISLQNATRATKKGHYDKATDSFELLGRIDGVKLRKRAPALEGLLAALARRLGDH